MKVLGIVSLDRNGQPRSFALSHVTGAGDIPAGVGVPIVVGVMILALVMIGVVLFLFANWKEILRAI